eukprot:SAG31_NODE_28413_length_410_cov_1.459807_1_plen_46_part_10
MYEDLNSGANVTGDVGNTKHRLSLNLGTDATEHGCSAEAKETKNIA